MPNSVDAAGLKRLRAAFERFSNLPLERRAAAARRAYGDDPGFLAELLHLLDAGEATSHFLAPPSTFGPEGRAADEPLDFSGRVLARRWRLGDVLGSGSQGVVYEASDAISGGRAAVKVLRRSRSVERVRRESAALRWLRLPGVVRLLDQGEEGGIFWLAMERIEGTPFPGAGRGGRWDAVEPVALGLLEALARVHGAGVSHGDLKPHNVLVDARGVVTILDLGLAGALTDLGGQQARGGTPGYAAPEVLDGSPPDALADLWSAGVLLFEAAAGRRPERRRERPKGVPDRVARVIARLLSTRREDRPASAAEAVRLLRAAPPPRRTAPWSEQELRLRFRGHDWFHHLREDAARELHRRTGGRPAQVEDELASWIRAGLARVEDGLVEIDRVALDRLPALPAADGRPRPRRRGARLDARLAAALRTGEPRRIVLAAVAAGRDAMGAGRSLRALSAFELGAAAAAKLTAPAQLRRTLTLAATAALGTATAREIERALWLVERSGLDDAHARTVRDALRAAAAYQSGDARTAWRLATRATRAAPRAVQPLAWSVRMLVAQTRTLDVHRRAVAEAVRWARRHRSPAARRGCLVARAWLRYREGRCAEAARIHVEVGRRATSRAERLRSLVDAAVSARDAGADDWARDLSRNARRRAAALRLPVREARAYLTERRVRLENGEQLRPNLAALSALDALGFDALSWTARTTESVIAWRRGDTSLARAILEALPAPNAPSHLTIHQLPVACLRVALGAPTDSRTMQLLARRAVREAAPALAVQCLALLATGAPSRREDFRRSARRLRLPRRGRQLHRVRELLSVEESLSILA